ncbi:MAG TPA: cupin domain-containing protein, partial [Clostridia bacterium]|nr:cupin domain-containing protein [Clostridia bacterium]
ADILECLGTDLHAFFRDKRPAKVVFSQGDMFEKEDNEELNGHITWLVPNAQSNTMEPILVKLAPGGATQLEDPHEGEEFGYVL